VPIPTRFRPIAGATWRATISTVQVPDWPTTTVSHDAPWRTWITAAWAAAGVADAVAFASPDLARQVGDIVAGRTIEPAKAHRIALALARYLLRMRGRATPFGLFAGAAPLPAGNASVGGPDQVRVRVAGGWLAKVIAGIESAPGVLDLMRVAANDVAVVRGDRLYVGWQPHSRDPRRSPREVSLRYTRPVALAVQTAAQPILVADLVAVVHEAFPATDPSVVRGMIAELVDTGALITGLRAPLTTVDALGHLLHMLRTADVGDLTPMKQVFVELAGIHEAVERSGTAGAGADTRQREEITRRMRGLAPAVSHCLVTDVRLGDAPGLPAPVLDAAAYAVDALARLSPAPAGSPGWRDYHARFLERYGAGGLVPVNDLVDPAAGLGFPDQFTDPGSRLSWCEGRDQRLLAIAQQAALDRVTEIMLTDTDVTDLAGGDAAGQLLPAHMDVTIDVRAPSREALDRGVFTIAVVGVGRSALATGGRFRDLFDQRQPDGELATTVDGALLAQVSFPPYTPAMETVARTSQFLPTVITVGEHRTRGDGQLRLRDLAVTADLDRMYLVALPRRQIVEPVITCAAAPHTMPAVVRLLLELSRATGTTVRQFSWGAAGSLPFLPRLRYGAAILSPARWQLSTGQLPDRSASLQQWRSALAALRERLALPGHVYVGGGDQRLRIALNSAMDAAVLRDQIERACGPVSVAEAPGPDDVGWCGRAHEVTVPVAVIATPVAPAAVVRRALTGPVTGRGHGELPGGGSLFAKLYGIDHTAEKIIAEHLPQLWCDGDQAPDWWFVRYRDPRPHLRLRLRTCDYGREAARIGRWAAGLRRRGLAGDLTLDTYRPETARYGCGDAMRAAEELFSADSTAAVRQMAAAAGSLVDAEALTAASMVDLLTALLGGADAAVRWLLARPDLLPRAPQRDRSLPRRAATLANLAGDRPDLTGVSDAELVARAWDRRRVAASCYAASLTDTLTGPAPDVVAVSLLHMHHNRVHGTDLASEARIYHLARSTALAHIERRPVASVTTS